MLELKKLTVENFRGIRLPVEIDFVKNGMATSVVIYGRNGTGKSSLLDAWEWLLNFSIVHLGREGVSANDFPHKASGGVNCSTAVVCEHPDFDLVKAVFNAARLRQPDITGRHDEFRAHCTYPNYLRYSDLQDFVFKTKTEKYKYLAKFFGLEEFTENQDLLKAIVGRLTLKSTALNNEIQEQNQQLTQTLGSRMNEASLLSYLNNHAEQHGLHQIRQLSELPDLKASFGEIVASDPKTLELTQWKALQTGIEGLYPLGEVASDCAGVDALLVELTGDSDALRQIFVTKLLEMAIATIPQLGTDPPCPLCDSEFDGDLLQHVELKHDAIKKIVEKKALFDQKKRVLKDRLSELHQKINRIDLENLPAGAKDQPAIEAMRIIQTNLGDLITSLTVDFTELAALERQTSPCVKAFESLAKDEASITTLVRDQVTTLENDPHRKNLANDFAQLITTTDRYERRVVSLAKHAYLSEELKNLEQLLENLTAYIQEEIRNTFTAISQEVMDCFNTLEGEGTIFRNPQVVLVEGRDRAIELDIEFAGERIRPAFKFLSESQINSFGLSIFLAAVKHFNPDFKFFILDDVINSFDAYKRPRIATLFAERFSDFQILMLTHDQVFFDMMQRAFPQWNRYHFTGWDYANGPKFRLARNYIEEVERNLDDDNPILAGQVLGRYLEWIFGTLSEATETALRYKVLNVYTLAEFYEPLAKRLRDKLKRAGFTHALLNALDEFEQNTIFRNYCAHWKNEANPFTTEEIRTVFEAWKKIEALIWCQVCKAFAGYQKAGNVEYVRCTCGTINLKDDSLYEAAAAT
jgi:hypothetical protein